MRDEHKLSRKQRIQLSVHLFMCKYCSAFVKNSSLIQRLVDQNLEITLTEAQKESMQMRIDQVDPKL